MKLPLLHRKNLGLEAMTEINQDFTMYQGDRKDVIITVRDLDGNILDITDTSILWMMMNASNKLSKSSAPGGGIILSDPENGELTIRIMPNDTLNFEGIYFQHEAELTDPFANVSTITVGNVAVRTALIPEYLD